MRRLIRAGALVGVTALATTAGAPALAAGIVSQASANAVTVAVAGNENGSGTVTASHDGRQETVTGDAAPPIGVLDGQRLVNAGVLAQEATASVHRGAGRSAACAGVAGEGGSIAQVGDSSCLTPGQPVALTIANLDLSGMVVFSEGSELEALNDVTDPVVQQAIGPLTAELSHDVEEQAGNGGVLAGTLRGVTGRCRAATGSPASGSASIVDGAVRAEFGGQTVNLLDFPANPAPNTRVVTDLDAVVDLFIEALRTDLNNTLDGQGAPLADVLDSDAKKAIVDQVLADVSDQLEPLRENVLAGTLNEQTRPTAESIAVTAIDLQVLPAAQEQLGASLMSVQLGNVTCGPNGRVLAAEEQEPAQEPAQDQRPPFPTAVDSGERGNTGGSGHGDDGLLVALALLVATGVGWVGYRGLAPRS